MQPRGPRTHNGLFVRCEAPVCSYYSYGAFVDGERACSPWWVRGLGSGGGRVISSKQWRAAGCSRLIDMLRATGLEMGLSSAGDSLLGWVSSRAQSRACMQVSSCNRGALDAERDGQRPELSRSSTAELRTSTPRTVVDTGAHER